MKNYYQRLRKFQYSTVLPVALMLIDVLLIFQTTDLIVRYQWWTPTFAQDTLALLPMIFTLSWLLSSMLFSAYQVEHLGTYQKILYHAFNAAVLHALILLLLIGSRGNMWLHWQNLGSYYMLTLVAVVGTRCLLLYIYRYYRSLPFNHKKVIIIGANRQAAKLFTYFTNTISLPQSVQGVFAESLPDKPELLMFYKGDLDEVETYCLEHDISEIYYTLPNNADYLRRLQLFAEKHFIYLGIVPELDDDEKRRLDTQLFNDGKIPVFSYRNTPLRLMVNWHVKRAFDIVFSFTTLIFLGLFVFPLIALAIRLDSPGPIFFRQLRPGRSNRLFWCYKFRTMRVNQEEGKQATKNDSRITKVGAFLRKTSLDELPQFYNVLLGDMSVVGPRPNMQNQLEYYGQHIPDYALRHTITPGITGYAQVNGFRGETHELYLMEKRVEYDLQYMQEWSLMLDLRIIWLTVWNILKGEENAY